MEVQQSTYFWKGAPDELAIILQNELGVTEDVIPARAVFMQLTSFHDEDGLACQNALVTFYNHQFMTVGENFVL